MNSKPNDPILQESDAQIIRLMPDAVAALKRNLACGQPAVEVEAARAILQHRAGPQSTYEFRGELSNRLDVLLERTSYEGCSTPPPMTVASGDTAEWSGGAEGFEFRGYVGYKVHGNDAHYVKMHWYIPLIGYNQIWMECTIPGVKTEFKGGSGWHAYVQFYLEYISQS